MLSVISPRKLPFFRSLFEMVSVICTQSFIRALNVIVCSEDRATYLIYMSILSIAPTFTTLSSNWQSDWWGHVM